MSSAGNMDNCAFIFSNHPVLSVLNYREYASAAVVMGVNQLEIKMQ